MRVACQDGGGLTFSEQLPCRHEKVDKSAGILFAHTRCHCVVCDYRSNLCKVTVALSWQRQYTQCVQGVWWSVSVKQGKAPH
jgi:hypothetical protein